MNNIIDESLTNERELPNEKYLQAYFGRQNYYYIEKYKAYLSGDKYTFNISAFLVGFMWFFYRKLWVEGLIIVLFLFVLGFIEGLIYDLLAVSESTQRVVMYISTLVFGTLWGLIGNYIYIRKAERSIHNVLSATSNEEERVDLLTSKGGVSLIPYIVILLFIILLLLF